MKKYICANIEIYRNILYAKEQKVYESEILTVTDFFNFLMKKTFVHMRTYICANIEIYRNILYAGDKSIYTSAG